MPICFFVSDLHGSRHRYSAFFDILLREMPDAVFLGGDLYPGLSMTDTATEIFIQETLIGKFSKLKQQLANRHPAAFLLPPNDDAKIFDSLLLQGEKQNLWYIMDTRKVSWRKYSIYGYACVPPTPFRFKDREKYDVSRFVDTGCVSPEEGERTIAVEQHEIRYGTIAKDLDNLTAGHDLSNGILLIHTPPYRTDLDRAALEGKVVNHVPMDVHVGSIAVKRLIEERQPMLTLHGHIHESARLTGSWKQQIGRTLSINAAHDGPELALVRFDSSNLKSVNRVLL